MTGLLNLISVLKKVSVFVLYSYYIMDGSKRRVTFDDADDKEAAENETIPAIETEEIVENEEEEEDEVEETVNIIN